MFLNLCARSKKNYWKRKKKAKIQFVNLLFNVKEKVVCLRKENIKKTEKSLPSIQLDGEQREMRKILKRPAIKWKKRVQVVIFL